MSRALARDILARNLRDLCSERGLDASALTLDLGWAPSKVEATMSGSADIDLDDLTHLAETLDVAAHILLTASAASHPNTKVDTPAG